MIKLKSQYRYYDVKRSSLLALENSFIIFILVIMLISNKYSMAVRANECDNESI